MFELLNGLKSLFNNMPLYEKLNQLFGDNFGRYKFYHLYDETYIFHSKKSDENYNEWLTKGYIITIDKANQDIKVLFDGYFPEYIDIYRNDDKEYVLMGWTPNLEPLIIKLKGDTCLLEFYEDNEFNESIKELLKRKPAFSEHLKLSISKDKFILLRGQPENAFRFYHIKLVYNQNRNEKQEGDKNYFCVTNTSIKRFLRTNFLSFLCYETCISTVIGKVDLEQSAKIVWYFFTYTHRGTIELVFATDDYKVYYVDTLLPIKRDFFGRIEWNISFDPESKSLIYETPNFLVVKHNIITDKREILDYRLSAMYDKFPTFVFDENTIRDVILFQEKKIESVLLRHPVDRKQVILTHNKMYEECYYVGTDKDENNYYVVVDRKNLLLQLLRRKLHPEMPMIYSECEELQSFALKDENSFNFQIYEDSKFYYNKDYLERREENLPVLQINNEFYIFDGNTQRFIKLDVPGFQNIKVLQISDFYLIKIEEETRTRYDFYYQTKHFTFYSDKNAGCEVQLIQLPFWNKELLYVCSLDDKIKNWYILDYVGNQVNAECLNENTIKQDIEKKFLQQIKKCIHSIHEYSFSRLSVKIATINFSQINRLYQCYRSFYQAKAMTAFAKGLFQIAKNKSKTSSLVKI